MDGTVEAQLVPGIIAAGPGTAAFVLLLIVVLRRPPAVAQLDSSVERWVARLEKGLDESTRRELAREYNDSEHRAWDSGVLLAVALADSLPDVRQRIQALGPPPRLSPDPSQWLDVEERRVRARLAAAPLAPDVPSN